MTRPRQRRTVEHGGDHWFTVVAEYEDGQTYVTSLAVHTAKEAARAVLANVDLWRVIATFAGRLDDLTGEVRS